MKKLGIIARADQGGLATQSIAISEHLPVAKALIVDLGEAGRGECKPEKIKADDVRVIHNLPQPEDARWLCTGIDSLWSAETFYADHLVARAKAHKVKTFLHTNPELYDRRAAAPDVHFVPTDWEAHRVPDAKVLWWPMDPKPTTPVRLQARHFVHVSLPAMADREGTETVLEMLRLVQRPAQWTIRRNEGERLKPLHNKDLHLVVHDKHPQNNWDVIPEHADVLVLPRRYGGLSLVAQEACERGMVVIGGHSEPYAKFFHPAGLSLAVAAQPVRMKAGRFEVLQFNARELAHRCDFFYDNDEVVAQASARSLAFAHAHSWERLGPVYMKALGLED